MSMAFSSYQQNCSKSQMCLFKILHIISSISPPPSNKQEQQPFPSNNSKGVGSSNGIDLNLSLCSIEESEDSESETPNNNNNNNNEDVEVEVEDKSTGEDTQLHNNSRVDHVATTSFQKNSSSNCLDLLIEAARVISEKDESDSEGELMTRQTSPGVKKRKERWVLVDLYDDDVAEEREPVVRSKRGRNQTLPYRFKDSVVEPLKPAARSQRPSSTPKRLLR